MGGFVSDVVTKTPLVSSAFGWVIGIIGTIVFMAIYHSLLHSLKTGQLKTRRAAAVSGKRVNDLNQPIASGTTDRSFVRFLGLVLAVFFLLVMLSN